MEKVYLVKHTVDNNGELSTYTEICSSLEKAQEELRKDYEYLRDDYDDVNEEESYIAADAMSAYVVGSNSSDRLEIVEKDDSGDDSGDEKWFTNVGNDYFIDCATGEELGEFNEETYDKLIKDGWHWKW